jgi:hypothetical protein
MKKQKVIRFLRKNLLYKKKLTLKNSYDISNKLCFIFGIFLKNARGYSEFIYYFEN